MKRFKSKYSYKGFVARKFSAEECELYDPLPTLSPAEALLRVQAGGQVRENELRKLYYGEQYDCDDNCDRIDAYNEYVDRQKAYYADLAKKTGVVDNSTGTEPQPKGTEPQPKGTEPQPVK